MNIQSLLLLLVIVLLFGFVVVLLARRRRKGSDPCSGCSLAGTCRGGCDQTRQKTDK